MDFFDLRGEIDAEVAFVAGSYVRAHQHASGARHGAERAVHWKISRGSYHQPTFTCGLWMHKDSFCLVFYWSTGRAEDDEIEGL